MFIQTLKSRVRKIFCINKTCKISHSELKIHSFEQESKGNENISFASELSFGFTFDFFKYQQKIFKTCMYRPNSTQAERVRYKFLRNLKCFYNQLPKAKSRLSGRGTNQSTIQDFAKCTKLQNCSYPHMKRKFR